MSSFSMVAAHSKRPVKPDVIFGTAKEAQDATAKHGFDNVIDSTIGALMDDHGNLTFINSVLNHIRQLSNDNLGAYAPIAGLPAFLEAVKFACFREYQPKGFIKAVATPGGTGAIKHAVWNYTDMGDTVLTSDWFWAPYHTICDEHGRKLDTYTLFNERGGFNIESFKEKASALIERQERTLIIINSPAHNPTGYSLTMDEWNQVVAFVNEKARNPEKKIILFVDVAYIDFAGTIQESREFFTCFNDLPQNFMVLVGYSMSKGFTLYGSRSGAILCITPNEELAEEFFHACSHSNRGAWSNGTRMAQQTLADVVNNPELLKTVDAERDAYRLVLEKRCHAFVEEADRCGLKIVPFSAGFFISIPCTKTWEVYEELKKENVFVIPLAAGLRFAPCAVSEEKCRRTPARVKAVMDRLGC